MNIACQGTTLKVSTRWAMSALLMSAALTLAACGGSNGGNNQSSSSSSAASSSSSAPSSSPSATASANDPRALEILDDVVKGDFAAATANFDAKMHQALPPEKFSAAWSMYQDEYGKYQSHGTPADVPLGDLNVVNVPLQMEKTPGLYRVTFRPDGTVAGLWFLPADAPMPTG